jgi:hypothetical protein
MVLRRVLGMVLLVLLLAPAAARAEEMGQGRWWRWPRLAERVKLSEAQKLQLDDKFYDTRRRLIDFRAAVEREQLELQRLLEQEPLNESAVMGQFKNLDAARGKLAQERFQFIVEVRKIVGVERFRQLEILAKEFKRRVKNRVINQLDKGRDQSDNGGMEAGPGRRR